MLKYSFTLFFIAVGTKSLVNSDATKFHVRIAGNRTILECVNGYKPTMINRNPKMYITTSQFVRKSGYPAEEHVVQTNDGHILTLHRIPGRPGAPPVFLQHGLVCSSFDWVVLGRGKALAFKLADEGYDVWLGNARGNSYSRCHTKYTTSNYKFWDFSWHEIGIYDLPAMITYVTKTTAQQIIYIGHSMGTTSFFVMAIERPDIASHVKVMIGLAPVAYTDHATTPVLPLVAPFTQQLEFFIRAGGIAEFASQSLTSKRILEYACTLSTQRRVCTSLLFFAAGFNPQQFNYALAPEILYHVPAGSSFKIVIHYAQEYNSKRFQYYDYGAEKNLRLYNSIKPPDYNISKIAVPIGIIWSDNDVVVSPIDVMRLYEKLPNKILNYHIEYPNFKHPDYYYAIDAPKYVYDKLLSVIENYK